MVKRKITLIFVVLFGVMVLSISIGKYHEAIDIMLNKPELSITDIKQKILDYTDEGSKVLVVYIDGLGYENYERLSRQGNMPNTAACGTAEKALSVYPPITDVAFSSMATGVTPIKHGIRKRGDGDLKVKTVFDELSAQGKSSVLVEGDIKILKDDVRTILNIDSNKNGTSDDEILETALVEAAKTPDLLMVHFHSFDDAGHRWGPYSDKVSETAQDIDIYVEQLKNQWKGVVIITADHGMHAEGKGGTHGKFICEDMYIPVIDTGVYDEERKKQ